MSKSQTAILRQLLLSVIIIFFASKLLAQTNSFIETERDLVRTSSKIFPFYYENQDSLEYYSGLFKIKLTDFLNKNPSTLDYPFQMLSDSGACNILTSADGLFRIYSWDTWLGGTMHVFENLYQYKSGDIVYSTDLGYGEEDIGAYFTDVFTLKTTHKTYYLAVSGGSFSSKDKYESISTFTIDNNLLNDTIAIIKTPDGLNNSINFEYNFFSIADRPERPLRLIKYDTEKNIIYIPIVHEDGKVTDRFILYQFTGQYFEHILTQKKN